jgi:hypothetical protein
LPPFVAQGAGYAKILEATLWGGIQNKEIPRILCGIFGALGKGIRRDPRNDRWIDKGWGFRKPWAQRSFPLFPEQAWPSNCCFTNW